MPNPPRSRFRWNDSAGRYIDATGRFVAQKRIREELDAALLARERRMLALAEELRTNQVSLERWLLEMRTLVKDVHLYSAAAAKGGWAQMAQADYGRVGQLVRRQYDYLDVFANDIANGLPLDGRFLRRTVLYGEAGRATYHAIEALEMEARQFTEQKSNLHPADHCLGCISEAERGWVPIGELIPIGERDCLTGCKCTMAYR